MPINDANEIEPKDGYDVISTLDVDLQDVAENALLEQLKNHGADHGTVVLMEVETGKVLLCLKKMSTPMIWWMWKTV